jgi:hypothetical protein
MTPERFYEAYQALSRHQLNMEHLLKRQIDGLAKENELLRESNQRLQDAIVNLAGNPSDPSELATIVRAIHAATSG